MISGIFAVLRALPIVAEIISAILKQLEKNKIEKIKKHYAKKQEALRLILSQMEKLRQTVPFDEVKYNELLKTLALIEGSDANADDCIVCDKPL